MSLLSTFDDYKIVYKLGREIIPGDYFGCSKYRLASAEEIGNPDLNWMRTKLYVNSNEFETSRSWLEMSLSQAADEIAFNEWTLVENIDVKYGNGYCAVSINNNKKFSGYEYYVVKSLKKDS